MQFCHYTEFCKIFVETDRLLYFLKFIVSVKNALSIDINP